MISDVASSPEGLTSLLQTGKGNDAAGPPNVTDAVVSTFIEATPCTTAANVDANEQSVCTPEPSTDVALSKLEDVKGADEQAVLSSEPSASIAQSNDNIDTGTSPTINASASEPPISIHRTTLVSTNVSGEGAGNAVPEEKRPSVSRPSIIMRVIWEDLKRERLEKLAQSNSPTVWHTTSKGGPVILSRQGTAGREVEPPSPISWDRGRVNTDMRLDMSDSRAQRTTTSIPDGRLLHITPTQEHKVSQSALNTSREKEKLPEIEYPKSSVTTFLASTGLLPPPGLKSNVKKHENLQDSENLQNSGVPHKPTMSSKASSLGGRGLRMLKKLSGEGVRVSFGKTC